MCVRIFCSVSQWISYSAQADRLLTSPFKTRRRISAHFSMSVYTLASCCFLDQNSLKTESLTKIQQVIIWALRF